VVGEGAVVSEVGRGETCEGCVCAVGGGGDGPPLPDKGAVLQLWDLGRERGVQV